MFEQRRPLLKPKEEKSKCRIVIKKKKDGSIIKEIQGECSATQLKALSEVKEIE